MNTLAVRLLLAAVVAFSGAVAFLFPEWGVWVAGAAITLSAAARIWMVVRYGNPKGGMFGAATLPLAFVGYLVFGLVQAGAGFFIAFLAAPTK